MTARRTGRRPDPGLTPAAAARRAALPAGQLRRMVLAHLRTYPGLDFSPAELANRFDRPKSRGAIIRICHQLTADGLTVRTQHNPQRYRAADPASC